MWFFHVIQLLWFKKKKKSFIYFKDDFVCDLFKCFIHFADDSFTLTFDSFTWFSYFPRDDWLTIHFVSHFYSYIWFSHGISLNVPFVSFSFFFFLNVQLTYFHIWLFHMIPLLKHTHTHNTSAFIYHRLIPMWIVKKREERDALPKPQFIPALVSVFQSWFFPPCPLRQPVCPLRPHSDDQLEEIMPHSEFPLNWLR